MVLLPLRRVGNFKLGLLSLTFVSKLNSTVQLFCSVSILVSKVNPNRDSTEEVIALVKTLDLNLQRHSIELDSSSHIDGILHKSGMVSLLSDSTSREQHPLELRLDRISMMLPLVLPPGELFFSDHDHLLQPVDFVLFSLPSVVHLLDHLAVSFLLRSDVISLLNDDADLFPEVVSHSSEVLVVLLSKVNEGFDTLNIFFTTEDVFLELHVLSDLVLHLLNQLHASSHGALVVINQLLKVVLELFDFIRGRAVSQSGGELSLPFEELDDFLVLFFNFTNVFLSQSS